jgi:hypothetical protein
MNNIPKKKRTISAVWTKITSSRVKPQNNTQKDQISDISAGD